MLTFKGNQNRGAKIPGRYKSTLSLKTLVKAGIFCGVFGAASFAAAERVAIPLGQQGKAWNVESPRHGITKAQVSERYGEPMSKSGPVGQPPIYKWEYNQFTVYFEGEHVIHSVVKHQPK